MIQPVRLRMAIAAPLCATLFGLSCNEGDPEIALVDESYNPTVNEADFASPTVNPFMPLTVGTTWEYEGETEDGVESVRVVVTPETKTILGVTCAVVRDTVWLDGELVEDTRDWFATDNDGNVWYFGEDSKDYEKNVVVSTAGSWEAGLDGAKAGIAMKSQPQVGDAYRQEYYKGRAEDMAEVIALNEPVTATGVTYRDTVTTKEWTPLEPDTVEHKFYARNVGLVLETIAKGGRGRLALVRMTQPE